MQDANLIFYYNNIHVQTLKNFVHWMSETTMNFKTQVSLCKSYCKIFVCQFKGDFLYFKHHVLTPLHGIQQYEGRIEREREGGIVKECVKERKSGKGNQERIRERQDHLKTYGFRQIGVEQLWREGKPAGKIQKQRQWNRIQKMRYNWKYKYLVTRELPKYLKERRKNGEQKVIARWKCQLCEDEEGTLEHWRDCREMETTYANLEEILSEEGGKEAVKWLRRIERRKKDEERQGEEKEEIKQV
ncbi:hypothetical protein E2986_10915 [Frieseomelitta varia]|uniref:Uncharacterized protein n=1 Tax=Frieseomelitta varia TaxID=561572 RepID=A0A833S8F9_9HYME|nr:hypothetical protein E2986_10915 [Frieseomelitta varia]